jgi:hypothetical protein
VAAYDIGDCGMIDIFTYFFLLFILFLLIFLSKKNWRTELRTNPYEVSHASDYTPEALKFMLEYPAPSNQNRQCKFVAAVTSFAGVRCKSIYDCYSHWVSFHPHSEENPRYVRIDPGAQKTDMYNTKPKDWKKILLPCICLTVLSTAEEKRNFAQLLSVQPWTPCVVGCPLGIFRDYHSRLPDNFGAERMHEISLGSSKPALKLMRAMASRGTERSFTREPLGLSISF